MTRSSRYISVASWEDRCTLSAEKVFSDGEIDCCTIFYSQEYEIETEANRKKLSDLAHENEATFFSYEFKSSDHIACWREVEKRLDAMKNEKVIFDISTTPREMIWYILHFLDQNKCEVDIRYSKPDCYGDWLSKDPGRPRLIYNHSGITTLGNPTALLLISGFDIERAGQLINYYEPKKLFLALQKGNQYDNQRKNIEQNLKALRSKCDVEHFEICCFSQDAGLSQIREGIKEDVKKYNIIATSLGPKPSSVALYNLEKEYRNIALSYIPSLSYNTKDYSSGIKETLTLDY